MAKLRNVKLGQTTTEQLEIINKNVDDINKEVEGITSNENGYITADEIPVKSVQGKTGDVTLTAKEVGAFPNSSSITELDLNNIKETGVYVGTYGANPYYLIVIKYNDTNIYQELIGLKLKEYRRFTGTWSEWIKYYSAENPVKAGDIQGIELVDTDKELVLSLLEDTTFVKANLKYNPATKSLYVGNTKFATEEFVMSAVNMIQSIIVAQLPDVGKENTIYFVPSGETTGNAFIEYVYVNNSWEIVGGTSVDLTPFLTIEKAEQTYAKISSLDDKVSKTTTINGKTLYNNITLTAEDVGALSKDTKIVGDVVYRHTNADIATKLTAGQFVENDVVLSIDDGNYKKGHFYKYSAGALTDITDIITDYVGLSGDQNINGVKNFNGILKYGGVAVATTEDVQEVENKLPTIDTTLSTTSSNPVENKAITTELNKKALQSDLDEVSANVDLKANTSYVDDEISSNLENYLPLTAGSSKKISGVLYCQNMVALDNNKSLSAKNASGTTKHLMSINTSDNILINNDQISTVNIGGTSIVPIVHNKTNLGTSSKYFNNVYGKLIYQNGKQVANKEDIPDISSMASTSYVDTKIADLVNSAPETLDTLGEVATAIQNNASVVDALNSAIGSKANSSDLDSYLPLSAGSGKKITGDVYSSGSIILDNTKSLQIKDYSGTARGILRFNAANQIILGEAAKKFELISYANIRPSNSINVDLGSETVPFENIYGRTIYQNGKQVANAEDIPDTSSFVKSSSLSAVATSGSYNDLTNKPTIPTVNNGTLTIQQDGTTIGTFTANQSGNTTVNIASGGGLKTWCNLTGLNLTATQGTNGGLTNFKYDISSLISSYDKTKLFNGKNIVVTVVDSTNGVRKINCSLVGASSSFSLNGLLSSSGAKPYGFTVQLDALPYVQWEVAMAFVTPSLTSLKIEYME